MHIIDPQNTVIKTKYKGVEIKWNCSGPYEGCLGLARNEWGTKSPFDDFLK